MKEKLLLLTMLVMLCGTISAANYDFHVGAVYYSIIYKDYQPTTSVEVVSGDEKYTGDIVIPDGFKIGETDYTVNRIGQSSFAECPDLTSISLPDGINSKLSVIGANAFQNCKGLTSVVIPNTVTHIDAYAFVGCSNLKSVTIGNGVKEIGNATFNDCTSLERVDISDLVVWFNIDFIQYTGGYLATSNPLYYAKHLYIGGVELTNLTVPDEVTNIKQNVFYNCEGLTSVSIPNTSNVISIGGDAFYGCKNITSLQLNNKLKTIGKSAFASCELIESLVIPDEVTTIAAAAFANCTNLKELTLGENVEVIETGFWGPAFSGTAITEITVPEKLQYLSGFWNSQLNTVNIGTTSLIEIADGGKDYPLPVSRINITDLSTFMNIKKYLGGYDLYLNGNLIEDLVVPSSVEDIIEKAMCGCRCLKSVTIPSHVNSIGNNAFLYCTSIEKVTFEGGSPTIGSGVFNIYNNTYFITRMQTPSEAPYALVNNCNNTHILCVPSGCKEKYETAEGWKEFRYIVEAEPEEVFLERGNLYRINGNELTFLKGGNYGLWGYYMPETVTYQEKTYDVTTIDGVVYEGFSPDIVIYNKVKSIAEGAFASCTGVHSVTSYLRNPFAINSNVFSDEVKQTITLRVPYGTKTKYQSTDGWKDFQNIVEMDPEPAKPYAVYDNGTLTFYDDNLRSERQGTTYDLNEGVVNQGQNAPGWIQQTIQKVVFDASFSQARPTTTSGWFYKCSDLTTIEGWEYLNTSQVVYMDYMFANCTQLETVDLSHFNTGNVTSMQLMFDQCKKLKTLDLSGFDTHSLKYTYRMFGYCGITQLDLSSWKTSNLIDVYSMFAGCEDLAYLNLSSFNTNNVTNMNNLCIGCRSLSALVLGNQFACDATVPVQNAFMGCEKLKIVAFTGDIPAKINNKLFEGVGSAESPVSLAVPEQYKANYQTLFDGNQFCGGYFTLVNAIEADVTGDGHVTEEDIAEVEKEILDPSMEYNPVLDVNHDGVVNVADIVEIVKMMKSNPDNQ